IASPALTAPLSQANGGTGVATTPALAALFTLPTAQIFNSGSGTYNTPANCRWISIRGGGGGGSGSGAGATSGGNGGDSTFSSQTAGGGAGSGADFRGGVGGTSSGGTYNVSGGPGET